MLKSIFILFFSFWLCIGFSQNSKKRVVYKNLIGVIISESDFNNIVADKKILIYTMENDSLIIKKIFQHDTKGFLEAEQVAIIRRVIEKLTAVQVQKTDTLVINFFIYPNRIVNGSCVDFYTNDRKYKNFFKKKKNSHIKQFFLTEATFEYKKDGVFRDKQAIVQDICFNDAFDCGNYIIVYPDNSFIKKYGEYRQAEIVEYFKK